jgi:maltooligosyltrehalose trehalohydrolase
MPSVGQGQYEITTDAVPGTRYFYRLNGARELPDPASKLQPEGVHGPSEIIDTAFGWTTKAPDTPIDRLVLYEAHVGTSTPEGTFDAMIPRLDELVDLGASALELMPISAFPGKRNWGYDVAAPFAIEASYGGPRGLQRLVDACHMRGLRVVVDVVYNHMGPEGCYLAEFGPYVSDRYATPWGDALNFDGPGSDEVRRYFLEHARYLTTELGVDGLRLDATHAIVDTSAYPFLEELADTMRRLGDALHRRIDLFPEDLRNDPRLVLPVERGGTGLDAQWNDDFHHALHALLTGERLGYYRDFGMTEQLAKAMRQGFVFTGEHSAFRGHRLGRSGPRLEPHRFIAYLQNHDQVGNRSGGERIGQLVSFEKQKLGAGALLLAPFVPLLFMGEEYGDPSPFSYFVDHSDPDLARAVREGRSAELSRFGWPSATPDPTAESTFDASKLRWQMRTEGRHRRLLDWYRTLLALRRDHPALARGGEIDVRAFEAEKVLMVTRSHGKSVCFVVLHFGDGAAPVLPIARRAYKKVIDSADERWGGPGSRAPDRIEGGEVSLDVRPESVVVYEVVL